MIPVLRRRDGGLAFLQSDAWNNVTFAAGEVRRPSRNLPLALGLGTLTVTLLYILGNVAYLNILPFAGDPYGAEPRPRDPARPAGPRGHRRHLGRPWGRRGHP